MAINQDTIDEILENLSKFPLDLKNEGKIVETPASNFLVLIQDPDEPTQVRVIEFGNINEDQTAAINKRAYLASATEANDANSYVKKADLATNATNAEVAVDATNAVSKTSSADQTMIAKLIGTILEFSGTGTFGNLKTGIWPTDTSYATAGHSNYALTATPQIIFKSTGRISIQGRGDDGLFMGDFVDANSPYHNIRNSSDNQHEFQGKALFKDEVTAKLSSSTHTIAIGKDPTELDSTDRCSLHYDGLQIVRTMVSSESIVYAFGYTNGTTFVEWFRIDKDGISLPAGKVIKPQVTEDSWSNLTGITSNTIKVEKYPDNTLHITGEIVVSSGFNGQFICQVAGNPFGLVAGSACSFAKLSSAHGMVEFRVNYNGTNTQFLYGSTQSGSDFISDITAVCPIKA